MSRNGLGEPKKALQSLVDLRPGAQREMVLDTWAIDRARCDNRPRMAKCRLPCNPCQGMGPDPFRPSTTTTLLARPRM